MAALTAADAETAAALAARLRPVSGPLGAIGWPVPLELRPGSPGLPIAGCATGDLAWALDEVAGFAAVSGRPGADRVDGAGGAFDPHLAAQLAAAEALERYCSVVHRPEQLVVASAAELGDEALDLRTLPRLSAAELARPDQRLRPPRADRPMRWVRAVRLHDARPTWVPAALVWLCYTPTEDERITASASTGCALHPDPQQALLNGLLEVVERDAVAVLWRQRLPLPELVADRRGDRLTALLDRFAGSDAAVTLFDATLDLGVPTVFAVHVEEHNPRLRQVVGAGADLDPERAAVKAVREAVSCRLALEWQPAGPTDPAGFSDVMHGALLMGAPERAPAFDFLLGPRPPVPPRRLSDLAGEPAGAGPGPALRRLVGRLQAADVDAYAVDLTTDEARETGCTAVKVLVPGLQPLSFAPAAQFLASPRLYRAPAAAGYPVRTEADLNPYPQPFA